MDRKFDALLRRWEREEAADLDFARHRARPPLEKEAAVRVLRVDRVAEDATVDVRVGAQQVEAFLGLPNIYACHRPGWVLGFYSRGRSGQQG